MNHLIFDTETTGFYNPKLPATHQGQARVIQLAAVKLDNELNEIDSMNVLIKLAEGYKISEGAFGAHGISMKKLKAEGIEQKEAMIKFNKLMNECNTMVAHNFSFDFKMIDVEVMNMNTNYWDDILNLHQEYCTMHLMTPVCRLPHSRKNAFGQAYKWPKLIEAMNYIGKPFVGREHDGLSDARACAEIYRWLIANKHISFEQQSIANPMLA